MPTVEKTLSFSPANDGDSVSAILMRPAEARWLYVMAHGAGAGMTHSFLARMAMALAEAGVATFRYQFPYMESGRKRPDRAPLLERTVGAAVTCAEAAVPDLPILTGGKSMGGRMSSRAAAAGLTPSIKGIVFIGFPLHPPKKPGVERAAHLAEVTVPMCFLQGTRDTLADLDLITETCAALSAATLHVIDGADHSFHVLKRSGRTDEEVRAALAEHITEFGDGVIG